MSTLNSNEPKGRPPAPLFPLDQVGFSLAADYRIYVRKDLLQSGQADPSKSESSAHELVQLQPEDPILMDFDMKDAAWVDLKQAVLRTVESSQDKPNFGCILHELDSNGKLKWRAHMFGYDRQVASYTLRFDFAEFSMNFTTAETQITASIGIIMDYPLKAIRSQSKARSAPNKGALITTSDTSDISVVQPTKTTKLKESPPLAPKSVHPRSSPPASPAPKQHKTADNITMDEFKKLCLIPKSDYHTSFLLKERCIHHWSALKTTTEEKFEELKFHYGPAMLLMQGVQLLLQNKPSTQYLLDVL
ncbi:hypothetical protein PCANC_02632 [Puccinia coronata f. sp. avenae]|uniref:Uncharacterized protein n=1 Tax=Puccinia coronata f. sp. avenae TaxID=200324 RepID=A0A2N5W5I5_9BASI|nr:hypothetical protein PCANC_02632 [Puccinia coronata f. sp. avenae]